MASLVYRASFSIAKARQRSPVSRKQDTKYISISLDVKNYSTGAVDIVQQVRTFVTKSDNLSSQGPTWQKDRTDSH